MAERINGVDDPDDHSSAVRTPAQTSRSPRPRGQISRRHLLQASAATAAAASLLDPFAPSTAAVPTGSLPEEDGYDLWLRYREVARPRRLREYRRTLTHVVSPGQHPVLDSARDELQRGLSGLLGQDIPVRRQDARGAVVIGTRADSPTVARAFTDAELTDLGDEGFAVRTLGRGPSGRIVIGSAAPVGVLYGTFALLRQLQTQQSLHRLDLRESPANPLRMLNHWDNLDGTVERGYAGASIFWESGELRGDAGRHRDYARTLASVGINAASVTNVNANRPANAELLDPSHDTELAELASRLRPYGITMFLSPSFASPITVGGLDTADPLDAGVQQWWTDTADRLYTKVPDLGGFLVKADSEGQPGPGDYGRNHDDGANMLAAAVAGHGGLVIWRAFVYGARDSDRAKQAYEAFAPLDGRFADNVVVQVKNGPIDFQVREPVSPLFGAMPGTNVTCELQITQEYTGQATHLCYLVPQWKAALDTAVHDDGTPLREVVAGYRHGGVVGVANFGDDVNWTGHHLAAANAYGFGRLAWDPEASAEDIAWEWTTATFGADPTVRETICGLLEASWPTYEDYTSPLGVGVMSDTEHFDPAPASRTDYHQADADGVGYDRTVTTGSGYVSQYPPGIAAQLEEASSTPEELVLFFHHLAYTNRLSSGSTLIQHIYDTHFDGAARTRQFAAAWAGLSGLVDERRLRETAERFDAQIAHAEVWRDAIVEYFHDLSQIPDEHDRVSRQ